MDNMTSHVKVINNKELNLRFYDVEEEVNNG
jgi:hypothetical protein